MSISLLDDSLQLDVHFERKDCEYEDCIRIFFREECPEEERLFRAGETNIFITPEEASLLVMYLNRALQARREYNEA